jgi:hypothetical protein
MCDIPFDRSILQLSNGIRHVMPSTDRMLELTAKHRWLSRLTSGCVFQWVKPCGTQRNARLEQIKAAKERESGVKPFTAIISILTTSAEIRSLQYGINTLL